MALMAAAAHRGHRRMHRPSDRRHRTTPSPRIAHGKHIVMVNVEADVLAGPLLARAGARRGRRLFAGLRRPAGADLRNGRLGAAPAASTVVAAGKGTKYLPAYHAVDAGNGLGPLRPDAGTGEARRASTRRCSTASSTAPSPAIEMAAVANATGLALPQDGLLFPPCGVDDLPRVLAAGAGGVLERKGMVEVVSRLERDGRPVFRDLRWGVYVDVRGARPTTSAAASPNTALHTDPTGRYAALYKPYHLIGLELGVSVASAALRGEPTGGAGSLARRRRRHRQARPGGGRDAGRRRRLHGLGQAASRPNARWRWARCRSAWPTACR